MLHKHWTGPHRHSSKLWRSWPFFYETWCELHATGGYFNPVVCNFLQRRTATWRGRV